MRNLALFMPIQILNILDKAENLATTAKDVAAADAQQKIDHGKSLIRSLDSCNELGVHRKLEQKKATEWLFSCLSLSPPDSQAPFVKQVRLCNLLITG